MNKNIKIKRVYDNYSKDDDVRILVDRLWPRGIKKENAKIDVWIKEISPSNELRKWYSHDAAKWEDFKKKYFKELDKKSDLCKELISIGKQNITLLYSSKNKEINNAVALKKYLEENFLLKE